MRFYSLDRSMGRRLRPWLAPLALLASLAGTSALAHNTNNSTTNSNSITTGSHANTKPKASLKPTADAARMKLQGSGPEAVKVSARQVEPRLAALPPAVARPASEDSDGPHSMMLATLVMMAVIAVRRQSARRH